VEGEGAKFTPTPTLSNPGYAHSDNTATHAETHKQSWDFSDKIAQTAISVLTNNYRSDAGEGAYLV